MMTITELQQRYAAHPNVEAMSGLLKNPSVLLFLFWAIWKRRDISTMTLRRCWGQIKSCFSLLHFVGQ